MTRLQGMGAVRIAALLLLAGGAATLAACEEHAYPSAAPREGTAAPPPSDTLAGAPQGYGPPSTRTPAYAPPGYGPNGYAQNGYGPNGYGPPPPAGYARPPAANAPPVVISMAPIPNPPEPPPRPYLHRHHHWRYGYRTWAPAYPVHHHHRLHRYARTAPPPVAYAPAHAARPVPARPVHATPPASAPTAAPRPAQQFTPPVAPAHHHHHHVLAQSAAATAAAAAGGPTAPMNEAAPVNATGSEAEQYQTLQTDLRDAFARSGQIDAPSHMEANQPADVTLTLSPDFSQLAQAAAAKAGLGGAAASLNLTSTLTGDGYTVTPLDPQTLPLTPGQPTIFRWKATPTGANRGPLTASLRATPVGDTHSLDLGSKTTGGSGGTGRVVGIGLLAVVALLLLGFAAQRRRPAPSGAVRPRAAYDQPNPPPHA